MKNPTSFFSLKTQFDNVGDALINRELVRLVSEHGRVVVDLSRCPESFRATLGLEGMANVAIVGSTGLLFWRLVLARLKGDQCHWFLSPGGYFGELSIGQILRRLPNLVILTAMSLAGVRICHVGVSYERLGKRHAGFLRLRQRLLAVHKVRDERSLHYARMQGLNCDGVVPDLAFNLFQSSPDLSQLKGRVAFSFRADQFDGQAEEVLRLAEWFGKALPAKTQIALVTQVERDVPIMARVAEVFSKAGRDVVETQCYASLADAEKAYRACDIVVSNRLHALLIGASQSGRMLACVSGNVNEKIHGILADLNLQSSIVDLGAVPDDRTAKALAFAMQTPVVGTTMRERLSAGLATLFNKTRHGQ